MKDKFILFLLLVLSFYTNLYAQVGFGTGRIRGVISNESGQPLKGAEIELLEMTYKTKRTFISDENGRWGVAGIASGWYKVTANKVGYHETIIDYELSLIGQRVHHINITLRKHEPTAKVIPKTDDLSAAALLEDGNELFIQKKYQEALVIFEEIIKKYPKFYQVYLNIGNSHLEMKDYDEAIAAYNIFLEQVVSEKGTLTGNKDAAEVLALIGMIYLDQKILDKAKEYFELSIDIHPVDKILAYNLGELYFNQGLSEQAIDYLLKAIEIDEMWAPAYLKIGYAYLNNGQYRKALESIEKFLELDPDDPQAPSVKKLLPELKKLAKKEE